VFLRQGENSSFCIVFFLLSIVANAGQNCLGLKLNPVGRILTRVFSSTARVVSMPFGNKADWRSARTRAFPPVFDLCVSRYGGSFQTSGLRNQQVTAALSWEMSFKLVVQQGGGADSVIQWPVKDVQFHSACALFVNLWGSKSRSVVNMLIMTIQVKTYLAFFVCIGW
jgi:hypothetical protein